MQLHKNGRVRPILSAILISLGYIIVGVLFNFIATEWGQHILKTVDDMADFEEIMDFSFVIITGLILLGFSFYLFYQINNYSDRIHKQQQALLSSERRAMAGIFAASIAHDATNVLTSLRFCLEMLGRNQDLCSSNQELLSTMKQALQDLASLNRRLLDTSKRGISGELSKADLVQEIEKTLRIAKVSHRTQHCSIQYESQIPELFFNMNSMLINEMILNLVMNAADAAINKGEILIKTEQADHYAILEVHDSGPGVPDAIRGKIFDPFFTTKDTGTGLGLLTVKACAELHSGWVELSSSPVLGGALFRIWLPMTLNVSANASQAEQAHIMLSLNQNTSIKA